MSQEWYEKVKADRIRYAIYKEKRKKWNLAWRERNPDKVKRNNDEYRALCKIPLKKLA